LRLKAEENQIKAAEQQRKEENDETRANLDMMKMMQAREIDQTKIEENDKHQKLRAAVSMAKSGISSLDKQRSVTKKVN
jgi:ribonuclease PH